MQQDIGFKINDIFDADSVVENKTIASKTFDQTIITGCLFSFVNFKNVIFNNCTFFADEIENCCFENCQFNHCVFQFSCIEHCHFIETKFKSCSWESSKIKKMTVVDCLMSSEHLRMIAA